MDAMLLVFLLLKSPHWCWLSVSWVYCRPQPAAAAWLPKRDRRLLGVPSTSCVHRTPQAVKIGASPKLVYLLFKAGTIFVLEHINIQKLKCVDNFERRRKTASRVLNSVIYSEKVVFGFFCHLSWSQQGMIFFTQTICDFKHNVCNLLRDPKFPY